MADIFSKEKRSYIMSQIKGKDTKPELMVRRFLFANRFRYRLHNKKLPGTPDIVLPKYKTVIFVNGCFWHGHEGCKHFKIPQSRTEWWTAKINRNKSNDVLKHCLLSEKGYRVIIVWECEVKNKSAFSHLVDEIRKEETNK